MRVGLGGRKKEAMKKKEEEATRGGRRGGEDERGEVHRMGDGGVQGWINRPMCHTLPPHKLSS